MLKKSTQDAYKKWNQQDRAWVDMRLHESHDEGGFGIPNNTFTRRAAAYTTSARFLAFLGTFACRAQQVWLPGNDLQDPPTWDASALRTLWRLHASAHRLPGQQQIQNRSSAAQPPPRGIQAESSFPHGVFQLLGSAAH